MNFSRYFAVMVCAILTCLLTNCSSGSGHGSPPHITPLDAQTGRFLDSAVTGVEYSTPHWSHITGFDGILMSDVPGSFIYQPGEEVTFSIGGVVLGSAQAQRTVTPIDLVPGAVDTNNNAVINICQFLQSLDNDAQPENGILITEEVRNVLANFESIDFDAPSLESIPEVQVMFEALNAEGVFPENKKPIPEERSIVSAGSALIHFEETLIRIEQEEAAAQNIPFSAEIRKPVADVVLFQGQSFPIVGLAYGGTEPYFMEWILENDQGIELYRGPDPSGIITGLAPGNYVLQFNASDSIRKEYNDQRLITVFDSSLNTYSPYDEPVAVNIFGPGNTVLMPRDSISAPLWDMVTLGAEITYGNPPFFYSWAYPPSAESATSIRLRSSGSKQYIHFDNTFSFSSPGIYQVRITVKDSPVYPKFDYDVYNPSVDVIVR